MRKPILTAVAAIAIALLATVAALAQTQPVAVTVTGVSITNAPSANDTYGQGETISVQVAFSHVAEVTAGSPVTLNLAVGRATRQAYYASGSGTKTLTFSYTVQPGDLDADGVSVVQDSIQGSIIFQASPSVSADLTYTAITNAAGHKVNAAPPPPPLAFPATATVAAQTYTKGQTVSLALPEAAGGTAPLVYTLTAPTSSGATLPSGLAFDAITRTLSGTTTGWQAEIRYTYTVTDAAQNTASLPVDITVEADFDADDDQLIEVHNLAQLDAIRWDLDGDGDVTGQSSTDQTAYRRAFPGISGMGCKAVDHDNNTTTPMQPVCIGYELNNDLDFDTNGNGATYTVTSTGAVIGDSGDAYYNAGQGWAPLGDRDNRFSAIFDGNGNTISNLFINRVNNGGGLFGGIGQCDAGGVNCQGEVKNLGLLNVKVIGGSGGALAGGVRGTVTGCYADGGSVDITRLAAQDAGNAGGLIGALHPEGTITGSYANVTVTSTGTARTRTGGLVGRNSGTIIASYATGDVRSNGGGISGGLVGVNHVDGGTVITSYATGSVYARQQFAGSLVGGHGSSNKIAITDSYATGWVSRGDGSAFGLQDHHPTVTESYWDTGTTGVSAATTSTAGKTTVALQSPTTSAGIYAGWSADQWDFGTARDYPAVKHNGVLVPGQRRTSIHADNRNAPVIGEPLVAALHVAGATSTVWQWQSSTSSGAWANIAGANAATYIPVAADAGRHLRAKVTFTASGKSRTLTTVNTAAVAGAPGATASGAAFPAIPIVGQKLRLTLSATGATSPGLWRWQRCDDAAMETGCKFVASSEPANNSYTEYTPAAGTDSDVGKYLQAYVYYVGSGNGDAWTRAKTPVMGPVVAPPPTSTPSP